MIVPVPTVGRDWTRWVRGGAGPGGLVRAASDPTCRGPRDAVVLGLAREHLIRERVLRIWGVMCACQLLDGREDPDIRAKLDALCSPGSPHASCVRSFRDLYETDPAAAKAVWDNECENWLLDSPAR